MGANHARVLASHPATELLAIVDIDPRRGRQLAESHGAVHHESIDEVGDFDAAVIAVPTEAHHEVAVPLLERGVPLVVEKPLAVDPGHVAEMLAAASSGGAPLMCGFVERFNPAVMTVMDLLDEEPLYLSAVRHSPSAERIDTSVVHDLLIHDVDLALRIFSQGVSGTPDARLRSSPEGIVQQSDVLIGFDGGGTANISASRLSQRKVRTISVATAGSLYEIDLLRHDLTVYRHRSETQIDQGGPTYRAETLVDIPFVRHQGEPLMLQLSHFVDLVRGEVDPAEELATIVGPHEVVATVDAAAAAAH